MKANVSLQDIEDEVVNFIFKYNRKPRYILIDSKSFEKYKEGFTPIRESKTAKPPQTPKPSEDVIRQYTRSECIVDFIEVVSDTKRLEAV